MTDETRLKLEELNETALLLLRRNTAKLAELKISTAEIDEFIEKKKVARPRAKFAYEAQKTLRGRQTHERKKLDMQIMAAPPS